MIVKLLTEHRLEFLSLKGGCRDWSESTHVKMPHCWKSYALALFVAVNSSKHLAYSYRLVYSDVYRHCPSKPRQLRDCVQLGRLKCGQYHHIQICLFRKLPILEPLLAHQQNAGGPIVVHLHILILDSNLVISMCRSRGGIGGPDPP